jgi:hypothetical protein
VIYSRIFIFLFLTDLISMSMSCTHARRTARPAPFLPARLCCRPPGRTPDSDPTAGRARPVRSVALSHLVVIVDSLVVALWIGASRYRSFIPCPVRHGPDRLAPVPFRFAPVPKRPPSLPPSRAPLPRPPPPPLKWTCLLPPQSSLLSALLSCFKWSKF